MPVRLSCTRRRGGLGLARDGEAVVEVAADADVEDQLPALIWSWT